MAIIIQELFWDLVVKQDVVDITLEFEGTLRDIHIPYAAIVASTDEKRLLDYWS
jgi:hypothetical protein